MIARILLIPFSWSLLTGQQATPPPGPAMKPSIEKQKESARKQIRMLTGAGDPDPKSWFQYPWDPEPLGPPIQFNTGKTAQCDPLPMEKVDPMIQAAAAKEGIRPELVRAVMEQESALRPCAVSNKGAQGLMQLMPAVQQEFNVRDPFDPAQNINGGARYLKQLMTKYNGDLDLVLAAYNAGPARVDQDGRVPDIAETKAYVQAIRKKLDAKP